MRRSERILKKNNIQKDISWERQKIIENSILLKHIIDNDLKHMWRLIFVIVGLIVGLYAKSFFGG